MAIAKMKKLTLVARKKNRGEILRALQKIGAVHITEGKTDENLFCIAGSEPAEIEQKLSEIKNALAYLNKYDKTKKSLLDAKPTITLEKLNNITHDEQEAESVIVKIRSIDEQLIALRSQKARISNRISALNPYASFDAPFEMVQNTAKTNSFIGLINSVSEKILDELALKYDGLVYSEKLGTVMEYSSVFIIVHQSVAAEIFNALKSAYLSEFSIGDFKGVPKDIINSLMLEIEEADKEIKEIEEQSAKLVTGIDLLKRMEDYYSTELERAKAATLISGTEKTFMLEGWIIDGNESLVEKAISDMTDQYYAEFKDPNEDEQYPVALINKKILRPFEGVLDMYSMPDPRGFDPTAVFSPFYFIFFGMMVSDAAYGIVLTILALIMLKKRKPDGLFKKVLGVVAFGGISTFIWGALYGGWFGFELPALAFNPMKQPMLALGVCLGIGYVHVLTGLGTGAYMAIKRGQWLDAIFDKVLWIVLVLGLPMLALGGVFSTIGAYLSIIGAGGILLTNGRSKKGIVKKLIGGFGSLYGISGILSDILSYSRLFGMGLATGVIAMVFNTIAGLLTGSIIGWIFAAVVFAIGHAFNIGVNALGAYVQSCRLQYIEFFSKFYEDGGKPYKPLALNLKHYRLEN